jgi:hypothetical protein
MRSYSSNGSCAATGYQHCGDSGTILGIGNAAMQAS